MKVLKLKNYHIVTGDGQSPLMSWLVGQALPGKMSRARNKFIKMLQPEAKTILEELKNIKEKYAKKDKDDKPILIEEELAVGKVKRYDLTDEAKNKIEEEANEYLQEDYIIEVTPKNEDMIQSVKDIILNTKLEFQGITAVHYDEWCDQFEGIAEAKKKKGKE